MFRSIAPVRPWSQLVCVGAALALSACQTHPPTSEFTTPGWEQHHLANRAIPYDRLLVEIDAVAGTQPTPKELAGLKAFLEAVTDKPGGVTVKLDNIISRDEAWDKNADTLALQYLNGPSDDRTAFLYILCYRSRIRRLFVKPDHPQFTYFPYPCVIFIDRSYMPILSLFYRETSRSAILRHEVGHALGLAANPAHSERGHCTNPNCLMRPSIVFQGRRFFTFRQPWENTEFCDACRADLADYKSEPPKSAGRLWKGCFLQEKAGYQILSLPSFIYVHFGAVEELSESEIATARKRALDDMGPDETSLMGKTSVFESDKHVAALAALAQEKTEFIREIAQSVFEKGASIAEASLETEPETAREFLTDELIEAAKPFPEVQGKLRALKQRLPARAVAASDGSETAANP